ncbi:MAG TPA: GDSL-type esterase/lipase family protein [Ktedonobacteraceae bacterium]|jgi:lysophospholipase L1-like esterase
MTGQPHFNQGNGKVAGRVPVRKAWIIGFALVIVVIAGGFLLPNGPLLHAFAAGATQPAALNATPGNQQATLSWSASTGATSYVIEETNLANGQVQRLPDVVTGTSFTATGLATGQWYSFRVIPVNGAAEGTPSNPIQVRTAGYQGAYDHYYVLGDSYSAGEGTDQYTGPTGCYRSLLAYGYLLGNGVPTPTMIACSGAVTADIDQVTQRPDLPGTQIQQLQNLPQQGRTLITMTIGGNDVGFAAALKSCILSFTSCAGMQSTIAQKITALEPRLVQVYQEIEQASPGADIIILGYPLLVADPATADCRNPIVRAGLSKSEMTMIRTLAGQMDSVISQAATQAGVSATTTGIENAFAGYEACAPQGNNEFINEITGLDDKLHGTFHPDTLGYQADASAINAALQTLYQNGMVRS